MFFQGNGAIPFSSCTYIAMLQDGSAASGEVVDLHIKLGWKNCTQRIPASWQLLATIHTIQNQIGGAIICKTLPGKSCCSSCFDWEPIGCEQNKSTEYRNHAVSCSGWVNPSSGGGKAGLQSLSLHTFHSWMYWDIFVVSPGSPQMP